MVTLVVLLTRLAWDYDGEQVDQLVGKNKMLFKKLANEIFKKFPNEMQELFPHTYRTYLHSEMGEKAMKQPRYRSEPDGIEGY